MLITAVRGPVAAGRKVTVKVQLAVGDNDALQVVDCAKSEALVPPSVMLLKVSVAVPELVSVKV